MHLFKAQVYSKGINWCVDIPQKVSQSLSKKGTVPIKGFINNSSFEANLVSAGGGQHRLLINSKIKEDSKVKLGEEVLISLDER